MASAIPEAVGQRRRARRQRRRSAREDTVAAPPSSPESAGALSVARQLAGLTVFALFYLFILVAPLPMGGNRDWAWAPMAVATGAFALCCAAGLAGREALVVTEQERTPLLALIACFLLLVVVALLQMSTLAPHTGSAWYYERAAELLGQAHAAVPSLAIDASRDALLKCLACAAVFLVARVLFRERRWARLLLVAVMLSAALNMSYAMYAEFKNHSCYVGAYLKKQGTFDFAHDHCLMSGTFVGSNTFACFVGMGLVATIALLLASSYRENRRSGREGDSYNEGDKGRDLAAWLTGPRMALIAMALYLLGGALFSASRAGVAVTMAGIAALMYLLARGRSHRRIGRTAIVGIVFGFIVFCIAGGAFVTKMGRLSDVANLSRVVFWRQSLVMVAESPWLGWGLGSYPDIYAIHQPISIPQPNDKAHSTPVEFFVELGIPGGIAALAAGLLPWGVCLFGALRRRRRRYLPTAAFAVSGVAMLHSTIDFSLQIPAIGFVVSALLGMGWAQAFSHSELRQQGFFAREG
jgi:hypothetical protein